MDSLQDLDKKIATENVLLRNYIQEGSSRFNQAPK